MAAIAGASSPFSFNKSVYSDPNMRSHLEQLYNKSYAPMRERIQNMKEDQGEGRAPNTIQMPDGRVATELSAEQYEAAIPSFDKWLETQKNGLSAFDFAKQSENMLKHAQESLERLENVMNPDLPSNVRTVFSNGDQILGYINDDGSVVTHQGGGTLQKFAEQADKMNLFGQEKIAYIEEKSVADLSRLYSNFEVIKYNDTNIPTKREFAQKWYPDHDVDASYKSMLEEAKAFLQQQDTLYAKQLQNLNDMRAFLIKSMEGV